jgi:hypothetical protein
MRKALFLAMTVLPLLSNCAAELHDGPTCNPFPVKAGQCRGSMGAACDNFLTANQQILTGPEYEQELEAWESNQCVVEVTNSCYLAEMKAELEKLCSLATCTTDQAVKVKQAVANIDRLLKTAARSLKGKEEFTRAPVEEPLDNPPPY